MTREHKGRLRHALIAVVATIKIVPQIIIAIAPAFRHKSRTVTQPTEKPNINHLEKKISRNRVLILERIKYIPLVFITIIMLEGLPLFASQGSNETWAGLAAVALGGVAGVVGWILADSFNTLEIKRGFPLTVVALTWGLLGGLTVGFKFYASEVRGSLLSSTMIIAVVMGLISGFTGSLTTDYKVPLGRRVKAAFIFGSIIGFIRFFDVLLVALIFSKWPFGQKLWVSVKIGLLSLAIVTPLSLLSLLLGDLLGYRLKPILKEYEKWWEAMKEISTAVFGFLLAYLLIIVVFAGQFWALWNINRCRFYSCRASEDTGIVLTFWDFLYFSLLTMTTAGSGEVPDPTHALTQGLVGLEIFMGVVLTTLLVSILFTVVQRQQKR